ncbi:hypothetical protein ACHHYP_06032 [Achlya hypogyna]|uniref:Reverse transcriptase domain-containing protein n=1 Tax=Achlya hypogyna TaxID=1202772 RepID=A0A1V9YW80_ACHHY|nr:hypothetical protein ACHHYP_06032 [Achlya hypogyna]
MARPESERRRFYADLDAAIEALPKRDTTIICGDFNAKIGRDCVTDSAMTGAHARGRRNANGDLLADFCDRHGFAVTNTRFPKQEKNKTTWTQRRGDSFVWNQIDYILCPTNLVSKCHDAQSWGGLKLQSDHKLVTADFHADDIMEAKARYAATWKMPRRHKIDVNKLIDTKYKEELVLRTTAAIESLPDTDNNNAAATTTVAQQWKHVIDAVHQAATECLGQQDAARRRRFDDPELLRLCDQQQAVRLQINDKTIAREELPRLRAERNLILRAIKQRCCALANQEIDAHCEEIEALSPTTQMFNAVRASRRHNLPPIALQDNQGRTILSRQDTRRRITAHFKAQFNNETHTTVAPDLEARPLDTPITALELRKALLKLKNKRAPGPDDIPPEILKVTAEAIATKLTTLLNNAFATGSPIDLGEGTLICLPKTPTAKTKGQCSSLRPIVLLNCIRKAISLLVLQRISAKVDAFIGPYQSGFRPCRSTADAVWTHKWLIARIRTYKEFFIILGIDLSRAFDTIDRHKLLEVLRGFLDNDDIRLVQMLLATTTLTLRLYGSSHETFATNVGTPQGDSLSPVLFVVYLEAALRDVAAALGPEAALLTKTIAYADDTDFVCPDANAMEEITRKAPPVLAQWSLTVNHDKTEITHVCRASPRELASQPHANDLYSTKKLGSLLDDAADMKGRKHLATRAFHAMWKIWLRRDKIKEATRVRLYNCLVRPVLTYNCGTWALTPTQLDSLDSFHRHQLRLLLGIKYPHYLSSSALYARCDAEPLSSYVLRQRWSLFGHILRRPVTIPANRSMSAYFQPSTQAPWRGPHVNTLPRTLARDLSTLPAPMNLETAAHLARLRDIAANKADWKELVDLVVLFDPRQTTEDAVPMTPARRQPQRGPKRSYAGMDEGLPKRKRPRR